MSKKWNVHAEFGRNRGKFVSSKRKQWIDNVVAGAKKRKENQDNDKKNRFSSDLKKWNHTGRGIVEYACLADQLWCNNCDDSLSLKFVEKEYSHGLAKIFIVRCTRCHFRYKVATSNKTTHNRKSLYHVNLKSAIGMIDAGIGATQFNTLMSAINIQHVDPKMLKKYEREVGGAIEELATETFRKSICKEKELTLKELSEENTITQESSDNILSNSVALNKINNIDNNVAHSNIVHLSASFDGGWQKRGYNSLSGHASLIGRLSGLLLGVAYRTKRCSLCEHGHSPADHDCRLNHEGSAKSMESSMAIELVVHNNLLKEQNVQINKFIGDDDCSVIAAIRRESGRIITKLSDLNHAKKSITSGLRALNLSSKIIDYLANCFILVIKMNKDDPAAVERGLRSIVYHAYDEHNLCGDWCHGEEPDHRFKYLPHKKPLSDPDLKLTLLKLFNRMADNSDKLAPCASTQANEAFNHTVASKHPKSHHFAGSESFPFRLAAAACQKNIGVDYIIAINKKLQLSSGQHTESFRRRKAENAFLRAKKAETTEVKRRRLFKKRERKAKTAAAQNREGVTYETDIGFCKIPDLIQLNADDNPPNFSESKIVLFDLETSKLGYGAEICQIAGSCDEQVFNIYTTPKNGISPAASTITGLTIYGGELFLNERKLETINVYDALKSFIAFLHKVCEVGNAILVAHNCFRFDSKVILRHVQKYNLFNEFKAIVIGFSDTLPVFVKYLPNRKSKKEKFSLSILANDLLGPESIEEAHNAVADIKILGNLIRKIGVTSEDLMVHAKTIQNICLNQQKATIDEENVKSLEDLKPYISKNMIKKIATAGISMKILKESFLNGGDSALKLLLSENIGGGVRITKNKKIIENIRKYLYE